MELTMFGLWNINDLVECWRVRCIFFECMSVRSLHCWIIMIDLDLLRHLDFGSHQISFEVFWPTQNNILPFHQSINSFPAGSLEVSIAAGSRRKDQTLTKNKFKYGKVWGDTHSSWHGEDDIMAIMALLYWQTCPGLRVVGISCSTRQQHWAMGLRGAGYQLILVDRTSWLVENVMDMFSSRVCCSIKRSLDLNCLFWILIWLLLSH